LEGSEVNFTVFNGTINIGLVFKKDVTGKHECIGYADSDYA